MKRLVAYNPKMGDRPTDDKNFFANFPPDFPNNLSRIGEVFTYDIHAFTFDDVKRLALANGFIVEYCPTDGPEEFPCFSCKIIGKTTPEIGIGWSDFAKSRHVPGTGHSYSILTFDQVLSLVRECWPGRQPGLGEKNTNRKVVVPLPVAQMAEVDRFGYPCGTPWFRTCTMLLQEGLPIQSVVKCRQPGENLFIENFVSAADAARLQLKTEKVKFVKAVCYSAEALLENNGTRTTDCDWEIVALLASPVEDEPMTPVTCMRNQLGLPGGTRSQYSSEEWARAVFYWSLRARII